MTVGRHKGEDVSICARVFQTRLTNTDIDRYEINIGLKAQQQSRLPGETGGENTAKYSICEGICCVMVHRFCYPNMASLSLSLSLSLFLSLFGRRCNARRRVVAIQHFKNEGPVLFQART